MTSGTPFVITVTARDANGQVAENFRGTVDLTARAGTGPPATANVTAVGGTIYVQAGTVDSAGWLAGVAIGLLASAVLTVNNHRDIEHDRSTGRRTGCRGPTGCGWSCGRWPPATIPVR